MRTYRLFMFGGHSKNCMLYARLRAAAKDWHRDGRMGATEIAIRRRRPNSSQGQIKRATAADWGILNGTGAGGCRFCWIFRGRIVRLRKCRPSLATLRSKISPVDRG
jgi:hypothetical protein